MKIAVVSPTFNEAENILPFISALQKEFSQMPDHHFFLVIVDGNSSDGTCEIAKNEAEKDPRINLIIETKKSGLGAAYALGMKYALEKLSAEAVVEMDADFQHDPADLKRLVEMLLGGADYVIGSRYKKGGSIPKEWALYRKMLSFGGNIFSRIVLGLLEVSDVTSGYRIARSSILSKINLDSLEKGAFAYKIQLLFEMIKAGARVREIPIKFGLRDRGDSKMGGLENTITSLTVVISLWLKENITFIKFCFVGFAGLLVQTTSMLVLVYGLKFLPSTALLPSFLLAVTATFSLNNLWSFSHRKVTGASKTASKSAQFLLINVGAYFIQKMCILGAQKVFPDSRALVLSTGYPLGILIGLMWNYFFYSTIVWGKNDK